MPLLNDQHAQYPPLNMLKGYFEHAQKEKGHLWQSGESMDVQL
jgi:hypothetical protein